MKDREKLIVWLCVLFVVTLFVQYGQHGVTKLLMDGFGMDGLRALQAGMIVRTLGRLVIPLGIACWLFSVARRDRNRPWVWALLGLMFQFLAPILYFVIRSHKERQPAAGDAAS